MKGIAWVALVAALLASSVRAQPDDDFSERARNMLASLYTDATPGAVAVVSLDGEVVFNEAFGMASLELGLAMETDHVLRLASVTKQYAAATILALVEDGELALDDPLSKFLPDFPVGEVTVHQLLNHTSGIKSYTDIAGYMSSERIRKDLSSEELVAVFADEPVDFAPGEKWAYNNSGYVLLGVIIEQVTGKPWNDFLRQRLLEPLGIDSTDAYPDSRIVIGRVPGYSGPADEPYNASYVSMTQPHAAGALMSNALDVDRWQRALHGGEVLGEAMYARMTEADEVSRDARGSHDYGYGLMLGEWMGRPVIHHGGGINGFTSFALWLPEEKLSVVVLTNRAGPGLLAEDSALRLTALATGETYPADRPAVELTPDELTQFHGTYRIDEETVRTLRVEDGRLLSQRQGGRSFELVPVEGDQLAFSDSLSWFAVERDGQGQVLAIELHQAWGDEPERAERISNEVATRQAVDLAVEKLERLVGRYELQPGFVLSVRVVDAALVIQATGQPPIGVQAESETRFFNEEIGADIVFELPDSGPATRLTLHQGGQAMPAPRIKAEAD